MRFTANHFYAVLVVLALVFLIIDRNMVELPIIATSITFILMLMVSAEKAWDALKRKGRAAIITNLPPTEGGHSTIHPADVSIANSPSDSRFPNFCCFVTGGFVCGGMEWQGSENFFVCPPEHVEQTPSALICRTRFRRVPFSSLQDFIQSELLNLRFFDPRIVSMRKNLWFGMTSPVDGTSTTNLLQAESNFLDQTEVINIYKEMLRVKDEKKKQKGGGKQPIVLQLNE